MPTSPTTLFIVFRGPKLPEENNDLSRLRHPVLFVGVYVSSAIGFTDGDLVTTTYVVLLRLMSLATDDLGAEFPNAA
ncbi:MAG: hypothetical protein F4Y88_03685 [Chloroflexi bacterium]|nr:hypothetical protein [Chloroflexota bacterium]